MKTNPVVAMKKIAIIVFLATLIISPRILTGQYNLREAQQAEQQGDFEQAAPNYEHAAQRLFGRADLWNNAANAHLLAGAEDEAITAYTQAKEHNQLSAFGYDTLGQHQWQQGDHEAALTLWEEGLKKHPNHIAFYARFAACYREKQQYKAELEALSHWMEKQDAEQADVLYRLGLLLVLDSPEEALDMLTRASRADERFASVVETLRTSLNLAALEQDPAQSLVLRGRGLGLVEEWQLAADLFYSATQVDVANASAWAWLGEARWHIGEDARPALDEALNLQPKSVLVRSLRGLYFQREGELENALNEFMFAAAQEPENPNWQFALGETYARMGDLPPALRAYQQAVSLAPDDAHAWHLLALFSVQHAVQVDEIGLPAARKAVILQPENAAFTDTLGWIHFAMKEDDEAEQYFIHALSLDPALGSAHLHLGLYYLKYDHRALAYQSLLDAQKFAKNAAVSDDATRLLAEYFDE